MKPWKTFLRLFLGVIFCASLLLSSVPFAQAGVNIWTNRTPGGGIIYDIAVDPSNPSILYAATNAAGIFKSEDGGESWNAINEGLTSLSAALVRVSPYDSQLIYAMSGSELWKSSDGGNTWADPFYTVGMDLAFSPFSSDILYVAGRQSMIYKISVDGSYVSLTNDLPPDLIITGIALHPQNENILYISSMMGMYRSTNGGLNWQAINTGLECDQCMAVRDVVIDPTNPQKIFAALEMNPIAVSTDGGDHWQVSDSLPYYSLSLAVSGAAPNLYMAAGPGGLWSSSDSGSTWERNNTYSDLAMKIAFDPVQPLNVYVASWTGAYKAVDGATFIAINNGLGGQQITATLVNPDDNRLMCTATWSSGVFRTTDKGKSWTKTGPNQLYSVSTFVDPLEPGTIYLSNSAFWKSTDWCQTWTLVSNPSIGVVGADPFHAGVFLAASYSGLLKSTDSGVTWAPFGSGLPSGSISAIAFDPLKEGVIYLGTGNHAGSGLGLYKSTHGGENWTAMISNPALQEIEAIVIDSQNSDTLYAAGGWYDRGPGVIKSTDGGLTWTQKIDGLPTQAILSLAIDPQMPQVLYVGTRFGLYESLNAGESWRPVEKEHLANGLSVGKVQASSVHLSNITSITLDPQNTASLFAGTSTALYEIEDIVSTNPLLAKLDPPAAKIFADSFSLKITGRNFTGSSLVHWNGVSLPAPALLDSTHLNVSVPQNLLLGGGPVQIQITNPVQGAVPSNVLPLTIEYPQFQVHPSFARPGSVVTFTGSDFPADVSLEIIANGHSLGSVTSDGSGQVTFDLNTATADAGDYQITASVNGVQVSTLLRLSPSGQQAGPGSAATTLTLPADLGFRLLYLPVISR